MYWRLVARFTMGALFLVPGLALSLGLGEIQVHSALNQPMNAEIEILDFDASELDEVDVELGSQEIFERVGVPRPFILTRLKFSPTISQGKPVIRITSTDPVPEPFLTFLIDLRWSQGQLLREYTVLLDPPVFGNQLPGGNVQKPVVAKSVPSNKVSKRPAPSTKVLAPAPTLRTVSTPSTKPSTKTSPKSNGLSAGDTVTVSRGDTLWGISEQFVNGSGLSVSQMMLAIQDVNPDAFADNNINNLNTGAILRVPSQEAVRSRNQSEAVSEVRNQWKVWQKGQQLSDASAVNVDGGSPEKVATQVDAVVKNEPAKAELSILGDQEASEGLSGSDANAGAVTDLREQIALLKESVSSKETANEELLGRIASLDEILKKQESIIQLQNEQLAQLQNNSEVANEESANAAVALQEEVNTLNEAADEQLEASKSLLDESQVDTSSVSTIAKAHVEPLPDFSEPIPEEFLQAESGLEAEAAADAVVLDEVNEGSGKTEIVAAETMSPKKVSFVDKALAFVKENLTYLGGAGAILLAILALLGIRRRRDKEDSSSLESRGMPVFVDENSDEEDEEESVVATPDSVDQALDELEEVTEDSDKVFVDEPAPADNDEVLEEAEVYISYGLFQQAEDLLQQAIKSNPTNVAYQAKLAEVYHGENRTEDFIEHVTSNEDTLKKNPTIWSKVVGLGAVLAPTHALFSGGQSGDNVVDMAGSSVNNESSSQDDVVSNDLGEEIDEGSIDFSFEENEEQVGLDAEGALSQDDVDELLSSSEQADENASPIALDTGAEDLISLEEPEDAAQVDDADNDIEDIEDITTSKEDDGLFEVSESSDDISLDFDTSALEDELISTPDSSQASVDIDLDAFENDLGLGTEELDADEIKLDIDLGVGEAEEDTLIFDSSIISEDKLEMNDESIDEQDSEMETALFDSSLFEVSEINEAEDISDADAETAMFSAEALTDDETSSPDEDTVSIEQLQENLTAELETLSFDTSEIDTPVIAGNDDMSALETAEMNESDFDIDIAEQVTQSLDVGELDTEFSDIGNLIDDDDIDPPTVIEEVGTKLDLAKAFVDMGDEDAAKETLTEVLERGDMTQIREAKELLDKIT